MEEKLRSKTIFEGKVITVTHDEVRLPDGNTALREVVLHRGGVGILAIEDGCILLVKQYRYPNGIDTLEIPAGKLEKGENPDEACFREFEEETNRRASSMNLLFKALPTPGYCSEVLYIYEAKDFKEVDDSLPQDEDEFINLIKMPLDEAYKKVLTSEIMDAKTIMAIQYAYINKDR